MIINADDFGWSAGVTEGILRAHRDGVVTSASMAVNMPAAEAAARRLTEAPGLGVGVHLNVSQGPALSRAGTVFIGPDSLMNRSAVAVVAACVARPRWRCGGLSGTDAVPRSGRPAWPGLRNHLARAWPCG